MPLCQARSCRRSVPGEQRIATGSDGQYFVRQPLDHQFTIEAAAQVINVDDAANSVSVDPAQNGDAIVI
jgi:hypothetical protein